MAHLRGFLLFAMTVLLVAGAVAAAQQTGRTLFDQARARKASGDLQGATEAFEQVIAEFGTSDRNAAARALLELGDIVESLGQAGRARTYYDRVRNDFKDQTAEVSVATERLAKIANGSGTAANGVSPGTSRSGPSKVIIRTPNSDDLYGFAISPDGRTVVFQVTSPDGKKHLWRQAVDAEAKPEPIAGTEGASTTSFPFFSPDGKTIGFFAQQKVWTVDLAGGKPKILTDAPNFWGADWKGNSIIMSTQSRNGFVDLLDDGRLRSVTGVSGYLLNPKFIDDRRFIFYQRDNGGFGKIEVGSLDGSPGAAKGLPTAHAAAFTQGHLVFVTRTGALNALRFDPAQMAATGAPITLADRVGREDRLAGVGTFAVSAAGPIAYREAALMKKQMLWMDRNGDLVGTMGPADDGSIGFPRISPDGRVVLFFKQVGTPMGSVWAMDSDTGASRMLQNNSPNAIWANSGDRIVFSTLRNAIPTLNVQPLNAVGNATQFLTTNGPAFPEDMAPNGALLYRAGTGGGATAGGDLLVLLPNQTAPVPVAQTPAAERNARFSPDGNWIAYQSDESGQPEVYVQPFPGTTAQRQRVSLGGGASPQWGRKGRELYFIAANNRLMVATAEAGGGDQKNIEFGTPKPLFRSPLPPGAEYDTAKDGDRFLIISPIEETPPIIVLSNWHTGR